MKRRSLITSFFKSIGAFTFAGWNKTVRADESAISSGKLEAAVDASNITAAGISNRQFSLLRSDDLLNLRFEFVNMMLDNNKLKAIDSRKKTYMVVHFPPQHVNEETIYKEPSNPNKYLKNPPVLAQLAKESRLVFYISKSQLPLAFTSENLMTWENYQLSVAPSARGVDVRGFDFSGLTRNLDAIDISQSSSAQGYLNYQPHQAIGKISQLSKQPSAKQSSTISSVINTAKNTKIVDVEKYLPNPKIEKPKLTQTAIYAPYRLAISPSSYNSWKHSQLPVARTTSSGGGLRTELWHTRLGTRVKTESGEFDVDENDPAQQAVRAIWSADYSVLNPQISECFSQPKTNIGSISTLTDALPTTFSVSKS